VTSADLSSGVEFRETDPKARRAPRTHHRRLIERGDVVLDPFCGCGATVHAAQKLKRQWIGIDVTHLAIALIERRLKEAFPGIAYEVNGVPKAELNAPTREMEKEAASAGFYETAGGSSSSCKSSPPRKSLKANAAGSFRPYRKPQKGEPRKR
jgi:hypothetical protein